MIRGITVKNRICMPPCVLFGLGGESGIPEEAHAAHYRRMARGGAGLIIQEATCVDSSGKLYPGQLGLWSDTQIPGHRSITDAVHAEGVPIMIQLHHAGVAGIQPDGMFCASDYRLMHNGRLKQGRAMTEADIKTVRKAFADAAVRASLAGYDGVELHGCHGYLICQFYNRRVNRRDDAYGRRPGLFALEVYRDVRAAVPDRFAVGIRLGAFEPALADGIVHAQELCAEGIDFIDVSYGFPGEAEPFKPEGFPYQEAIYAAGEIKRQVTCPVFAVNGIRSAADARGVLSQTGVDMAGIARGMLVNPNWANDARAGRDTGRCLDCAACCWRSDRAKCPGRKRYLEPGRAD
jgi:2,4-dienoyl-CoA reductase-like NADH-dependent reductase (Old Yellow Enzyme family)